LRKTTRSAWAAELLKAATIVKPEGSGPFPVVFQMHGCGGLRPFMQGYTDAAFATGAAVVTVDSFKPRGLNRLTGSCLVCTGLALKGAERAADVLALYHWARHEPWVDPDRIAFAGWSHGAWTIMDALALGEEAGRFTGLTDLPADPLRGLAAAVLVYPYAAYPARTIPHGWGAAKPKVSALLCGKDQVVGVRYPARAIDRIERDGVPVQRLVFPDATHAFDDEGANDPRARHRPDLVEQARAWYAQQLRAAFG
jgi:dienelactone hydrolase